jgi:peptide/nickel transport system permease protein
MLTYIIRRLLLMIPTLLGITMVVFFVMAMSPGGVGGAMLKGEGGGGEMDAEKTRAMRAYYQRRYGLDRPILVQYLRWLNQVSPIGFRTSSQLVYADGDVAAAKAILKDMGLADNRNERERSYAVAKTIAAYEDGDLVKTTRQVALKLLQPSEAMELFSRMDRAAPDNVRKEIEKEIAAGNKNKAQELVLKALSDESEGANRVLFARPVIKWPDLGDSNAKGRPVSELYGEALPITLLLNIITTPIIYVIAIATGVYAGRHRGKAFDIFSGAVLLALWSIPVIWAGVMFIGLLANEDIIKLFPTNGLSSTTAKEMAFLPSFAGPDGFERGWLLDRVWHLILPIICLTYGGFAYLSKIMRSALLENLSSDYVRTARAKGVDQRVVLWQHAFRNSMMPLITNAAQLLPGLIAGALIVESIFSIPGMGKLTVEAILARDRELVLAGALVGGILGMISILIADLCYALVDPRVSFD